MLKRWNLLFAPSLEVSSLQANLKIHTSLCEILVHRGIKNYHQAKDFFRPDINLLHDPFLMKDMDKAVSRILKAFSEEKKILVFGDYDVDGTTSVSLMYSFLAEHYDTNKLEYYIPHRYREGYGISKAGIDHAFANNFDLIISLDCGIKSFDLITYAKDLGIDFIVCDHHLPDDKLPPAVAILNAKQKDCNYPYKELCGCGVGFKLITALAKQLELPDSSYLKYLDLVVTAIGADIVPLSGENRILAYYGLKKLNEYPCAGIKALFILSKIEKPLTLNNVVFVIAPRINAAGRMDDAKKAVQLFIEKDPSKALEYAGFLQSDNIDRREKDSSITDEALALINNDPQLINRKTTVVFQPHWHKGVVGIVASRLIETYYRPTIVLTQSGEVVAGSARSVSGFNLYEAIHACREFLIGYGGHFAAAGMTLHPDSVIGFSNKFEEVVSSLIEPHHLIPEIVIDTEISFVTITKSYLRIIDQMEPFGPENCKPVFLTRNVRDTGYSKLIKDSHLKLVVSDGTSTVSGIGFNMSRLYNVIENRKPFDIVYTLEENEWNGTSTLQLKIIDLRASIEAADAHLTSE